MALLLLITWFAVFLSSFKGVKSSGKVVYVTVILPYIILLVLFARFMTLPGSINGLIHFFKPDWNALKNVQVWGEAALHVFYSLSTCTGGIITLSSYNRYHNNLFRDIWIISIADLVTSILVSSLIFSAIGFVCVELGLLVDQFRLQVFVFFSEAISKLPVAPLYSLLFFLMVALIIFNTELFMVETIVSAICDEFPERLRRNHRHVLTFLVLIFYILGVPLCTASGMYWIVLLETFAATWPLIIIAFFECMVISWVYGADNFLDNIKWMTHVYPPFYILWKILWKFLCPLLFMTILSFVWLEYKPVHYDTVIYPSWAHIAGWILSISPVFFILLTAIYKYATARGSLAKRWRDLLCPEDDWGPALAIHRAEMFPLQIPEARKLMQSRYGYKQTLNGMESISGENASEGKPFNATGAKKHESSIPTKISTTSVERETII
uniref:Uncharacterized protein n=1 Tax=Acrobeloides nanus TaxID=290746 RepID=A0A914BVQ2_9BILA